MTVAAPPKTAAIRLPSLGRLWGKQKVQLRPSREVTTQIMRRLPEQQPTTRIMRRPGADEIPTRRMGQSEIPTRRMTADEVPTERMLRPRDATTRVVRRNRPEDEETRVMENPELAGDRFILPPRQEELDFFTHRIPRGMVRTGAQTKVAIRLPGLGRLGQLQDAFQGARPKLRNYFSDMMGGKLRQRGQALLDRPGARAGATAAGAKALRSGRMRQIGTPAAGAGIAGTGLGMLANGGGGTANPQAAVQERLQQRLDSPVGGLLDDIINPETEEMAAARTAKREELGDNISLMQRWQLMDPSMRTLLVSLLLGGGLGLAGSLTR